MIPEFFAHFFALDVSWFAWLLQANLFWIVVFGTIVWIYFGEKNFLPSFGLFVFYMWAWVDILPVTGWVLFIGSFLVVSYIARIAGVAWAESDKFLGKNLVAVNICVFITTWVVYNLFLR